ncbi:MAG: class A beta-lactamase [Cytophagales bacterium]|nr:MAG: class A beta-lactamase [Cytophagales bacterium]
MAVYQPQRHILSILKSNPPPFNKTLMEKIPNNSTVQKIQSNDTRKVELNRREFLGKSAQMGILVGTTGLGLSSTKVSAAVDDKEKISAEEKIAERISKITEPLVGKIGFSGQRLDGGPVISLNSEEHFPMASIFKIPIVLAALRRVQAGDLTLDTILDVSPDKYVMSEVISVTFIHPGISLSLANLIEVMITHSDNTATDIVQEVAGGPQAVTAFLKELGIEGMTVDRNTAGFMKDFYGFDSGLENIMQAVKYSMADPVGSNAPKPEFERDMRDQSTPTAMMTLLSKLGKGEVLNKELTDFILGVMSRTSTGPGRIKGLLPKGIPVAHKTGTIGGVSNDAGFITLPDGGKMVLSVFTKSSSTPMPDRDRAIAETARVLYEYFCS